MSAEEVRRVATLCHVGVSDDEVERLRGEMKYDIGAGFRDHLREGIAVSNISFVVSQT